MREQHLSDEAIAAFADGVLSGHARERARRHTASCAECHHAVAVQREAVWALRSAPAPSLPAGLLDRLREVPATTPIRRLPTVVDERGTAMFATLAAPAAALVSQTRHVAPPHPTGRSRGRLSGPAALTAASIAFAGVLAGASGVVGHSGAYSTVHARPAGARPPAGGPLGATTGARVVSDVTDLVAGHAR